MVYKAELCRVTCLKSREIDGFLNIFLDFSIVGNSKCKCSLKFTNPSEKVRNVLYNICGSIYIGPEFEFTAKENDSYLFFAILEYDGVYKDIVAFAYPEVSYLRLFWFFVNDIISEQNVDDFSEELFERYDKYQNLYVSQIFENIDVGKLENYLSEKIKGFKSLNKDEKFIRFIIEAFINSNIICDNVHSRLLDCDKNYVIIRSERYKKQLLTNAFKIDEMGNKCRLISDYTKLNFNL